MIFAPRELKATKLRDVPAGAIFEFSNESEDFRRVLKLANTEQSSGLILPLTGQYAFQVIPWSNDGEITAELCSPAAIRFRLGQSSSQADHHASGVLTLHPAGAFIATLKKDRFRGPKIDVATWDFVKVADVDDGCAKFQDWEMGCIDAAGRFEIIFSRHSDYS